MTRVEKIARAQALRAEGLLIREVAERMGVPQGTAATWLYDPDLTKQRTRRRRYEGRCAVCGGVTDGSGGYGTASKLCSSCRTWTEDEIIAAMQRWAKEHGGAPPRVEDWVRAGPFWPSKSTATRRFGWNELLLKAGFTLRHDHRPETHQWIIERLRAGDSTREIAARLGVSTGAIYERFRYRGQLVSDVRAGVDQ